FRSESALGGDAHGHDGGSAGGIPHHWTLCSQLFAPHTPGDVGNRCGWHCSTHAGGIIRTLCQQHSIILLISRLLQRRQQALRSGGSRREAQLPTSLYSWRHSYSRQRWFWRGLPRATFKYWRVLLLLLR